MLVEETIVLCIDLVGENSDGFGGASIGGATSLGEQPARSRLAHCSADVYRFSDANPCADEERAVHLVSFMSLAMSVDGYLWGSCANDFEDILSLIGGVMVL